MSIKISGVGSDLSRRRFVQGLAVGGAVAGMGGWPSRAWALKSLGQAEVLSGTDFHLTIGETPVNFTARRRSPIAVNGSVPAPHLRLCRGVTVTPRAIYHLPHGYAPA